MVELFNIPTFIVLSIINYMILKYLELTQYQASREQFVINEAQVSSSLHFNEAHKRFHYHLGTISALLKWR